MALWDNERRILDEIEERLSEDDPALAQRMNSFAAEDAPTAPDAAPEGERALVEHAEGSVAWKPWLVVGLIVTMILGLLALLVSVSMSTAGGSEHSAGEIVVAPLVLAGD
jgi:hypothetical protein